MGPGCETNRLEKNCTKTQSLQHMRDSRENGKAIVNIVCDMFRGFPMMSHTGAARAAVENLTK